MRSGWERMGRIARRALVALLCVCTGSAAAEPLLFHDALLFTGTGDAETRGWFVVEEGRFVAVGEGAGPPAEWATALAVDLEGRFVAPGFVDAEVHLVEGGMALLQADLSQLPDREALAEALAEVCAERVGGWCLARNLPRELLGEADPGEALAPLVGEGPACLGLSGGALAWVNEAGLASLGIDAERQDPPGGRIHRDEAGRPTGLLEGSAARDAQRAIYAGLPLDHIAAAVLAAQEAALRAGITAVGDDTYFPAFLKQYERLERLGLLHLRVAARAWGPEPLSRLLMRSVENERIAFFGERHFLDDPGAATGSPRFEREALEKLLADAGPHGIAFHGEGAEGAARLAAARRALADRRSAAVDTLGPCGACGDPELLASLRGAGLHLIVRPLRSSEALDADAPPAGGGEALRPLRAFFDAGLEPAIASGWPHASPAFPSDPAPLAQVAVAVAGARAAGAAIPGGGAHTVGVAEALRGITRNGADALGLPELGRIEAGSAADFVILDRSPFAVEPAALHRLEVEETWVDGRSRYRRGAPLREAPPLTASLSRRPIGLTANPIIAFDPTVGLALGGAFFFYPYEPRGWIGRAEAKLAPAGMDLQVEGEVSYRTGRLVSPHLRAAFDGWAGRHYGLGNDAEAADGFQTEPLAVALAPGARFSFSREWEAGAYLSYVHLREGQAERIRERAGEFAGEVEGNYFGPRLELSYDTRDNFFFATRGLYLETWAEAWMIQGSVQAPRLRFGAGATRFFSLYGPEWVLALRANAGATVGERGYWSDFSLGGPHRLRGYTRDRFRGDHAVDGSAELRFPLWRMISGAVFTDAGSVWVQGAPPPTRPLRWSTGGGIRIGLPPDNLIRMRLDVAFGEGESEVFATFGEAF